ncbi:MAG: type II toxin-antitoxin system RelE/ParE family toxin [bacterium]|nr:type II toxin-antitoxin system RelE/ParE family toxin [bacterium]
MVSANWTEGALADLETIDSSISKKIVAKISWLSENFEYITPETLHYDLKGIFKLRVGDYRALYQISKKEIKIQMIDHRSRIYKRISK